MTAKHVSAYAEGQLFACNQQNIPENVNVLIDEAVAKHAEQVLWTFIENGNSVTYREFYLQLARMANFLSEHGVCFGSHVAVMLGNTPEFFYSWLALARLGAVMVPVNTRYTAEELKFVINDSDSTFLITNDAGQGLFKQIQSQTPRITDERLFILGDCPSGVALSAEISRRSSIMPTHNVAPNDLMNIQYTSGTTGFPKGCMLTHRYWAESAAVSIGLWPELPKKVLSDSPFFYIDPQWELLAAFRAGGQLVAAPRPSLTKFMSYIRNYEIDFCSLWEALALRPASEDDECASLKYSWTFGLNAAEHAALEARFKLKAREMYAMTEIGCTLFMPWSADHMVGSGSCGTVAPYRQVKLRDPETGREVAVGEVGELCVKGEGIFLGYYNRVEANAELFIEDGWFRTGDLFQQDQNGYFYIVGRIKEMIRRSSENISAREVESVIEQIDEIAAVAAVAVPDAMRGEEVKVYIQLHPGSRELAATEVIDFCKDRLAAFKIPRFVEFIEEMPLTVSGKIAKKQLVDGKVDLRKGSYDSEAGCWL